MKIIFNGEITAANMETRMIEGTIIPFNTIGNTSIGRTMFKPGSVSISASAKILKLTNEHDKTVPIGKLISYRETTDGITGSFKISKSAAGNDALTNAMDGLKTGLSVGVDNVVATLSDDRSYQIVTQSELNHVGHVSEPAFTDAQISKVAASSPATLIKESEANVTTPPVVPPVVVPEVPPVVTSPISASAPAVTPDVATRPATPVISNIRSRSPIHNQASLLAHMVKAQLGDDDSRGYVIEANQGLAKFDQAVEQNFSSLTAANDSFTTNPAFSPVAYMNEFITNTRNFGRPTIEACGGTKPLPSQGMTFSIPKLTTAPDVALTTEAQAVQGSTGMVTAYITGTKVKYAGTQIISREIIDNGSDSPLFYSELMAEMNAGYDKATDAAAIAAIVAGGTQSTAIAGTLAGLESYIATESVAAYDSTSYFARNLVGGKSIWAMLIGALDSTGRPIFNAKLPMNAGGTASPTSAKGDVLGLDFWVDRLMVATTIDECAFIIAPETIGIYESPRTFLQIQVLPTLEVQVALYGYMTVLVKQAAGLRRFNLT